MNTIGRDKWPDWVKRAVGKVRAIEVKEHNGKFYAYSYKSVWDAERKMPRKISRYLGVVTPTGVRAPHEAVLGGIYEYGHVAFVLDVLERNGVLGLLKQVFGDWKVVLAFAMNRLIDPRPIKSMKSWYEKTYLVKQLPAPLSPKTISRILGDVGRNWKAQRAFFEGLRQNGEKIVYDGSVIFSSSKENPLLEVGYNKDQLLLTKANIALAFSHDRFLPVFLRVIPGSIHEITTLDILLEELGKGVVLVLDKGFTSVDTAEGIDEAGLSFILPLKRDSEMIDYGVELESFFMYRKRPIKYAQYRQGEFFVYLYEDLALRYEEERTYYTLLSKGKEVDFKGDWAGKIAILSNIETDPKEIYEMWKTRDEVEKAFNALQNILETDRPYVRKEDTFRGYLFSSFIGLIAYYLVLKTLKEAGINHKVSVGDALLELSKIYVIEIKEKEMISERSKRARKLIKTLGIENLITKIGKS
jgi:transposase